MKHFFAFLFLLYSLSSLAQGAEWTLYGPSFSYDKGNFSDRSISTAGILDMVMTDDGMMMISSTEFPIYIYKDGKQYSTQRFMFNKEGAKVQLVQGGETRGARAIHVDRGGNLWFGTNKGLHMVEVSNFQDLEKMKDQPMIKGTRLSDDTPGMPFNNVKIIRQDNTGKIWVTGAKESGVAKVEHKGLSKYDGGTWTNYLVTGAEPNEIKLLTFDDQNNPIVAYQTGILSSSISWLVNGEWKSLGTPGDKNDASIALLYGNNALYAATSANVYRWTNEKWERLPIRTGFGSVTDIRFDKSNNLWIATGVGVICLTARGGEYTISANNSPLPSNTVRKVFVDNNNKKWFVTDAGILGYKEPADVTNENMTVFTKLNSSFVDGKVESIVPYKDGLLMTNDEKGLVSFDGKSFNTITTIPETYYTNIAVDKNGVVYVGTYRYLHKYDGKSYTKWDWKDDIGRQVNHVLVDNQNNVWIASNGVSKFDGNTWTNFNKKNAGLSSNSALKLFQDSKNNIWATLYDGVARYDGSNWTVYTKKTAGVGLGNMNGIVETKDGKIWLSDGYKLIEFDGTSMKQVAGFKEAGTLRNMILDDDGTLLIATAENGIVKFKDGIQSTCNQSNCQLPTNAISQIHRDKAGKLWVAFGMPPAIERPTGVGPMGQPGQPTQAQPPPPENPRDVFMKKIKAFESPFGFMELKKL